MTQLNIEDFQINQWMFLFDGFGIKNVENQHEDAARMSSAMGSSMIKSKQDSSIFQPYLIKYMKDQEDESLIDRGNMMEPDSFHLYQVTD